VAQFREQYRRTMRELKMVAEKRLGANLSGKARSQTMCWKLLNRLRNPTTAVAIDSETLVSHFESVFFDRNEPLFFDLAALGIPTPINFEPIPFSDAELVRALSDLNAQAAVGPQRISSRYIKTVFSSPDSRVPLLFLMNRCFVEGKIPSAWGYSEVFVLYKGKGDRKIPVNYRGINLNDDFLRLYERLLDARLSRWLASVKPWGDQQFGFCSGVGTEDAALCLQTLSGSCTRARGFPLFANFVDLQRAFPSMLRSQILKVLNEIGVPFELIRAFAATFSGNSCRLRIGDALTRLFFVNRGTKEGGINSPKIFNTVYATALQRLNISDFPENVSEIDQDSIYFLVFADDLVLLGGNITKVEEKTAELEKVLEPLGMSMNAGKTKWMAFLPQSVRRDYNFNGRLPLYLRLGSTYLENVESFQYLGFTMEYSLSKKIHQQRRERLQSLAAHSIGRLLRSLEVTNFISLRSYYMALVRSQLYSPSFSQFSCEEYERAQKVFLESIFSLPKSFPIHVACFFLGIPDFFTFFYDARISFIHRLAHRGSFASLSAMEMDRSELLPRELGWNFELINTLLEVMDIREIDLLDDDEVSETRQRLGSLVQARRIHRFEHSSSAFLLDFFPTASIPRDFALFLKNLPYESVRILLIFFGNLFQFTYMRGANRVCAFCSSEITSTHFFSCPHTPTPYNNLSAVQGAFRSADYWEGVDRIFLNLQRWAIIDRNFAPGFAQKIEFYFQFTESQVVRRNSEILAMQMRLLSI
jgi:hypothetical protein